MKYLTRENIMQDDEENFLNIDAIETENEKEEEKKFKEMKTALALFELKRKHAESAYNELKDFLEKNVNDLPTDLQQASYNDLEQVEFQYKELVEYHYQSALRFYYRNLNRVI